MNHLKLIGIAFIVILLLDFIWLGFVAKNFYLNQLSVLGRIENGQFKIVLWAGLVVYLLLAIGIVFFVLPQIPEQSSMIAATLTGSLMGLIIYGVYDMTNYATLKEFPLVLAFADMAWGSVVCGLSTLATKAIRDL